MSAMLDMQGYRAVLARNEQIAQQAIAAGPVDLVILSIDDLQAGCEFAARLRTNSNAVDIPIIFLVPELTSAWSEQLHAHGGVYSMLKPFDPVALVELVEKALWMPHVAQSRIDPPRAHLHLANDWIRLDN